MRQQLGLEDLLTCHTFFTSLCKAKEITLLWWSSSCFLEDPGTKASTQGAVNLSHPLKCLVLSSLPRLGSYLVFILYIGAGPHGRGGTCLVVHSKSEGFGLKKPKLLYYHHR